MGHPCAVSDRDFSRFNARSAGRWDIRLENIWQCAALTKTVGSYVAHMPLCLPYLSNLYVEQLDYARDFAANRNLLARTDTSREIARAIGGWHANPHASVGAKAQLREMALAFFPPGPGQKPLVEQFVKTTARYASAVNRNTLYVHLRANGPNHKIWLDTHNDTFADHTAAIFYKGANTLHEWQGREGLEPVTAQDLPGYEGLTSLFRKTSGRNFVMWPMWQRHAEPITFGCTRVSAIIFASAKDRAPALT